MEAFGAESPDETLTRLVAVFKALADPTRLRLLGALAARPMTGKELSEQLQLTPPTISHHLSKLTATNLVRATHVGQSHAYALDTGTLQRLTSQSAPAATAGEDATMALTQEEQQRQKVIRDFFEGTRLKEIPARRKKRVIVLQHLAGWFDPARQYPEREVNAILRQAHPDVATLRRELVDYGYLERESGIYRVAELPSAHGPNVAQEITGDEHAWLRALVGGATSRAIEPH